MRERASIPLPRLPRRLILKKSETRASALFRILQGVAQNNRTAQTQTFYSLREVAENFTLPLSLVSRVFHRLEEEGLLGRIRGSRTVLHGRKYDRHLHVRGVVGLPVSIFRFAAFSDYRIFITQLRRQLRRRGFMPAAVFFERHEVRGTFLAEHLLEPKSDSVIWFGPDRESQESVAALRDAGVRLLGVTDSALASIRCRYEIRRENALRFILREWRAAGLTSTIVVGARRGRSAVDEERCCAASENELLGATTLTIEEGQLKRALSTLSRREKRGIMLTGSAAALCAVREPDAFWKLLQQRRVAFVDGPISLLFAKVPPVPVDLITVDWPSVAGRIVDDLVTQAAWDKSESLVFHAEAHLRVPLSRFCHEL